MPTPTYEPIISYTLPSNTTSYTFSSFPGSTYTDIFYIITKFNANPTSVYMRFNGDTTSNYGGIQMGTYNSSQSSDTTLSSTVITIAAAYNESPYSSVAQGWILGSNSTTTSKVVIGRRINSSGLYTGQIGGGWHNSTNAINSITILSDDSMYAGTKISFYGIKAA